MLEYIGTLFGMHEIDGLISSAEAAENKPKVKQVQLVPMNYTCNLKDLNKIRECLNAKFKDDKDLYPEMWDQNWINK